LRVFSVNGDVVPILGMVLSVVVDASTTGNKNVMSASGLPARIGFSDDGRRPKTPSIDRNLPLWRNGGGDVSEVLPERMYRCAPSKPCR
jgi:hypothetical protein